MEIVKLYSAKICIEQHIINIEPRSLVLYIFFCYNKE